MRVPAPQPRKFSKSHDNSDRAVYDGTLLPFATGFFLCTLAALAVVLVVEKGRLFRPHHVVVP
jgi:hypothetical protein